MVFIHLKKHTQILLQTMRAKRAYAKKELGGLVCVRKTSTKQQASTEKSCTVNKFTATVKTCALKDSCQVLFGSLHFHACLKHLPADDVSKPLVCFLFQLIIPFK